MFSTFAAGRLPAPRNSPRQSHSTPSVAPRQDPQPGVDRQKRHKIIGRDFGLHLKGEVPRRQGRSREDVLVILRDGAKRTQHKALAARGQLPGENTDEMRHHPDRRIAVRTGIVDHRIIRLRQGQHHSVQLRHGIECLTQLEAKQLLIGRSQQIEFPVLVQQSGNRFRQRAWHHHFAVPVKQRLSGPVGQRRHFAQRRPVSLNLLRGPGIALSFVPLVRHQSVQTAGGIVTLPAHLETLHAVRFRRRNHPPHVVRVQRRGVHQRPGDFGSGGRKRFFAHEGD